MPLDTLKDWLDLPAPPAPAPAGPAQADDLAHARIASVVEAWRRWDGGFSAFCAFVRTELAIDYGPAVIRDILATYAGRRTKKRSGRTPDEKATRNALLSFFRGAQWFQDGSPIAITLNERTFTFNWELGVDGYSCALVGASLRPEKDARAVVGAFEDGVATTGATPLALTTDNRAPNHAPEVAAALGDDTLHVRTTLGRPQDDAPVEGAFGLFQQTAPPLVVRGDTDEHLARAILAVIFTVWCRASNHRPRKDRDCKSRVQLYQGEQPTPEQIAAAKAQLEERRRRQELAFRTRQVRLDPEAGPRYLLGIVKHTTERREGLAIAEHLWRRRLEARDRALGRLDEARRATPGSPGERLRAFVDRALEGDGTLNRSSWLAAAGDVVLGVPLGDRKSLFEGAARRIHATFRVDPRERQAAVGVLAEHVLPVA